jgi:pimeloyl-ACP methyl ester carboxylesterase
MLSSCAYLETLSRQDELQQQQETNPLQHNAKHLITRQTYFVYGQLKSKDVDKTRNSLAVVALSNKYQQNEIVDINHLGKVGSYYAMNLPAGSYQLLVLEDSDRDEIYRENEIIAQHHIVLDAQTYPEKVVGNVDIQLAQSIKPIGKKLAVPVSTAHNRHRSLFFPKGTIRSLGDPIFSERVATLGMYEPAAFMETAPMMFYALEEDTPHKVPVIFVHGIGGTAKEFQSILNSLDRKRYKPWFFYYPSGMDLKQLAKLFYNIYLSGKVIKKNPSATVIVAHSMGGLVVREALNLYEGNEQEIRVKLFITMASPLGGLESAQTGIEHAPLVLPAWRGLTPEGAFIGNLFRKPLPPSTEHHLVYAYLGQGDRNDTDGIVPVQSQVPESVSGMIAGKYGYKSGHAEILREPAAIDTVLELIGRVKSYFPEEHVRYFNQGGFDVELNSSYSDLEKRMIHTFGIYLRALANGKLKPVPLNQVFLDSINGRSKQADYTASAWIKFRKEYPDLAADNIE